MNHQVEHDVDVEAAFGERAEAVHFDYAYASTVSAAFDGVDRAYVLMPSDNLEVEAYLLPVIAAAAQRGAKVVLHYLDVPRDELLRAVRSAARGEVALSPSVAARLMSRLRTPAPSTGPLSQRELDVLRLVAGGNTNREAAAKLFITEATVKTHLLNIYAKLDVNDRAAAVAEGYNRGLLGR